MSIRDVCVIYPDFDTPDAGALGTGPSSFRGIGWGNYSALGETCTQIGTRAVVREPGLLRETRKHDLCIFYALPMQVRWAELHRDYSPLAPGDMSLATVADLVARIECPAVIVWDHSNMDEVTWEHLPTTFELWSRALAMPHVIGLGDPNPYYQQTMQAVYGNVFWLPPPYDIHDTPRVERVEGGRPRIIVSRSPASSWEFRRQSILSHLVARDVDADVVYMDGAPTALDAQLSRWLGLGRIARAAPRGYDDFLSYLATFDLYINMEHIGAWSRWSLDAASVGLPAVVSDRLLHTVIYPETTVAQYDVADAAQLARELIADTARAELVGRAASQNLERYCSPANVLRRIEDRQQQMKGHP